MTVDISVQEPCATLARIAKATFTVDQEEAETGLLVTAPGAALSDGDGFVT